MSRTGPATLAGIVFILVYIVAVVSLADLLPPMHWAVQGMIQAVYWLVAGTVWVIPVRWLMLWAAHKR